MELEHKRLHRVALELAVASFIVLFQELAYIRWLPSQVRVLAYFPNLILLSAFLGLGLGCLRSGGRSLLWVWPLGLLTTVLAAWALGGVVFTQNSPSEHLYLLYYDLPEGAPVVAGVQLPIVAFFVFSAVSFVPLGQLVAERLLAFRLRSSSLWGYCWDIVGSLLGVAAFAAFCFAGTFPVTWFLMLLVPGLLFFGQGARRLLAYLAMSVALLWAVGGAERAQIYSPYYAMSVTREADEPGFRVLTNGSLHQFALVMDRDREIPSFYATMRASYYSPYRQLKRPPRRALVVGAGTGNDVATLLELGAERIDAVEIDPSILRLGREKHPSRPYASPRVQTFNTDARSFLNNSQDTYDLIVFGTLDSMTRLSALSNVRLDNFVYTLDSVRTARELLSPDGGVMLFFMVGSDYIDRRLAAMLIDVFGEAPLAEEYGGPFNRVFMAGPAFDHVQGPQRREAASEVRRQVARGLELPTDDWPYLYLRGRGVSGFYLGLMAAFATLAVLGLVVASPEMRRSFRSGRDADWEMFLFGLGFLLLETRAVTAMNVVWGATWLTSAVVFGSILFMVLASTVVMQLWGLPYRTGMAGITLSLLATYLLPSRALLVTATPAKLALSVLLVGAPVFFAGTCFARVFKDRQAADRAFGWNLLGAVAGGLLEFVSMAVGLRALLLIALVAYLLAFLIRLRSSPAAASTEAAPS